mgnify:FL=1
MAAGKKSFLFYTDWIDTFKKLPKDKGYDLLMHMLSYVNDENPETDDILVDAVFQQIKNTLKRDLNNWENQQQQRKEAGLKSAEIRKRNATSVNECSISSTDSVSVNVSDSVNESVNVIVKENNIESRKLKFASTLQPFLLTYGKDFLNDFYKYWTEPNKSNTKFKQELEKTWSLERRLETWAKNEKNFERKVAPKETKSEERSRTNMDIIKSNMEILKQRENGTIAITE